jgi:hypothetical protein
MDKGKQEYYVREGNSSKPYNLDEFMIIVGGALGNCSANITLIQHHTYCKKNQGQPMHKKTDTCHVSYNSSI